MLGLPAAGRYRMYVEIRNSVRNNPQICQPRLLTPLAKRSRNRIFTAFEMTSHLQPAIQPAVMMQQQTPVAIDDETTCGEVTRHKLIPRIRLRRPSQEMQERGLMLRFTLVGGRVGADDHVEGNHW